MKILKVSIKNLNSLKGSHEIDFSKEPFVSAGLFAITGATGSGKTTILDAITLALFGKASRYGNESNPENMMTRGASECSAEVVFEVKEVEYTAQWSLLRARGKFEGKIQPPERKLFTKQGEILASQIKEVTKKIEEVLGLDHERFMRSVMLAQGQFSKFLSSKPDERAQLLESLTGSEIYSKIGEMVFEKTGQREQGIQERERQIQEIVLLDDTQIEEIKSKIAGFDSDKKQMREEFDTNKRLNSKIEQLEKAEGLADSESVKIKAVEAELKSQAKEFKALADHSETIPFTEALTKLTSAEGAYQGLQEESAESKQALDESIETLRTAAADFRATYTYTRKEKKDSLADDESRLKKIQKESDTVAQWLENHKQDALLASKLGQLTKLISNRDNSKEDFETKFNQWYEQFKDYNTDSDWKKLENLDKLTKEILSKHTEAIIATIDAILQGKSKEKESAKKDLADATHAKDAALLVEKYDKVRETLKDGCECPLCGSKDHPWVKNGTKTSPKSRFEKDIEAANLQIVLIDKEITSTSSLLSSAKQSAKQLLSAYSDFISDSEALVQPMKAAGFGLDDQLDDLQKRADRYSEKKDEFAEMQSDLREVQSSIKSITKEIETLTKDEDTGVKLPDGIKSSSGGDEDLDFDDARELYKTALSEYRSAKAVYDKNLKQLKSAEAAVDSASNALDDKLKKSNFKNIKALREAQLSSKEVERLTKLKNSLDKRLNESQVLLKSAQEDIKDLVASGVPTGEDAKKIKTRHSELLNTLEQITQNESHEKARLKDNEEQRKKQNRLLAEMKEELSVVEVWRKLRDLIGSKDGAKFRKFAQSISLEILTRRANKHLHRLNDRYTLLLEAGDTLELQVEDHYQAGSKRPLASLSGGESFLASLALALGLSDLAGRSVKIDTLFIDEGFGTLDPETLEVALTALDALRQGNKSVGVISHIDLLKERITTQIVVTKSSSGHSTLNIIS
jgi:DNA repair protein SbcC/Rad50